MVLLNPSSPKSTPLAGGLPADLAGIRTLNRRTVNTRFVDANAWGIPITRATVAMERVPSGFRSFFEDLRFNLGWRETVAGPVTDSQALVGRWPYT
jgi:hypothetical protein